MKKYSRLYTNANFKEVKIEEMGTWKGHRLQWNL